MRVNQVIRFGAGAVIVGALVFVVGPALAGTSGPDLGAASHDEMKVLTSQVNRALYIPAPRAMERGNRAALNRKLQANRGWHTTKKPGSTLSHESWLLG